MKSLFICAAVMLLMIATPYIFSSIDNVVTQEFTQSLAGITTDTGVYAANVTLSKDIYLNDTAEILEITSNNDNDYPTGAAYNTTTNILEVTGLSASETRTLSIQYLIEDVTLPSGSIGIISGLLRWFWVIFILCAMIGAIYAFFTS